ncbi:hypothetical protein JCM3765_005912 [Sporobolomyces pararoseus]
MHLSLNSLVILLPLLVSALPSSTTTTTTQVSIDRSSSSSSNNLLAANTASSSEVGYQNKVYLIRHGEKGSKGETGLNLKGKKRAKCLRKLLSTRRFKIGLILAEEYDSKTHKRKRPFDTVKPIADELGLKIDTECKVEDSKCVKNKIEKYSKRGGKGDVLICWKHSMLHEIVHTLGAPKTKPYPDDRYDIMWTLHHSRLISKESEHCPGLDPKYRKKHHDKDLELDIIQEEEEEEEDLEEEEEEIELDWMFEQQQQQQLRLSLDDQLD